MSTANLIRLVALAMIWGTSFMLMRIASPVFGPFLTTFGRASLGALAIYLFARSRGIEFEWKKNSKVYLIIGLGNTAVPFSLFAWSALHVPSAYMATMNSLAPIFTAVFGFIMLGEGLSWTRIGAFMMGLFGVAVLVGIGPIDVTPWVIAGVLAGMGAAVCYGFAATYTRMYAKEIPALATATGSQFAAALALLPFAAPSIPHAFSHGTAQALLAVGILGVVCTGIAYAMFFQLISTEGASKAVTVTFLIPATASIWAAIFLGEAITHGIVIGIAIVLCATAISLGLIKIPGLSRKAA
ncbi:DMT family transporter [Undibacterium cyanobacteriorum]|uniref:DMT family transporter n=1 Tax=Undibacterium cyanobacteriorum TaxID=3073561 RepID=A0ABY9RKT8_9BURK|nr:DMT family transporter [Undibacterium sp. 20NA77.5]WMW81818.1 DMT family transporter [Undibacterium sp. 20NA77.5]